MSGPLWQADFSVGQIAPPLAWAIGGFIVGWLLMRIVGPRLKKLASLSAWDADDILVAALHDVVLWWFAFGGMFGAIRGMPLRSDFATLLERLVLSGVILSATWVLARVAGQFVDLYMRRSTGVLTSSTLLVNIAKIFVIVIGLLVLLQTLGVQIAPMLGALGIGGLAVALALQDTLASIFAGIQLLASKKVQAGDFIELASGQSGQVIDINWRNTTVRALPNNDIIIPNSTLANEIITNYHRPEQEMSVIVQVGVAYDSDLEHVERVTIEVAKSVLGEVDGGVPDFEPFTRYHTFGDSSINFSVILRTMEFTNKYKLQHEFIKRLKKRYDAEGIEIPFPIRTLELGDSARAQVSRFAPTDAG